MERRREARGGWGGGNEETEGRREGRRERMRRRLWMEGERAREKE